GALGAHGAQLPHPDWASVLADTRYRDERRLAVLEADDHHERQDQRGERNQQKRACDPVEDQAQAHPAVHWSTSSRRVVHTRLTSESLSPTWRGRLKARAASSSQTVRPVGPTGAFLANQSKW